MYVATFCCQSLPRVCVSSVSFDYETRQTYSNLSVVAVDKGTNAGISDPAAITVYINNINDNSPVFNKSSYGSFLTGGFVSCHHPLLHTLR